MARTTLRGTIFRDAAAYATSCTRRLAAGTQPPKAEMVTGMSLCLLEKIVVVRCLRVPFDREQHQRAGCRAPEAREAGEGMSADCMDPVGTTTDT